MKPEPAALIDLASSVADGEPVDWAGASAGARDDHERQVIDRLRIIASIGEVHRSDEDVEGGPAGLRGRIVGHIRPGPDVGPGTPAGDGVGTGAAGPLTGQRWGHLLLKERVGSGVYGEVYRAFDESLRREVAVKLLKTGTRSSDLLAAKILHEGRLLARVRHRNVVTVHGVETHGDRVGLWMEFLRGGTFEQLLERQGPFGGREASLVGQDLCRALAAVHGAGLVHRDLKAQNVIREEGGRVVLMDFGTGLLLDDDEAVKSAPMAGTPLYLAPEVLEGHDASPRSDIYSLGVLLFHLVTGTYPYVARTLAELRHAQRTGERKRLHDLRPDLAEGFVQMVERALEPDPAARYQSAGAMQRALSHALGLESGLIHPVVLPKPPEAAGAAPAPRPQPVQRWRIWAPFVVAGVLLIALLGWALRSLGRPVPAVPIHSVVVLPFASLSTNDAELSDGIEQLINDRLSALSSLRVVAYTPGMAERDRGVSVADVMQRHGVDAAVQGSVTWSGATAQVAVEVMRAGVRPPIWSRQFERPLVRAAELPRDVSREIVRALGVSLSSGDEAQLAAADQAAPAVFESYLRGRAAMRGRSADSVAAAITQFLQALSQDPNHAPSLAALSECYLLEAVTFQTRPLPEAAALARQASQRALALDESLSGAHMTDAQLRFLIDWDAEGAEACFRRAVQLSPNSGEMRQHFAMFLASRRRLPDAMQQMQSAVALDPASLQAQAALGMIWHYARSNDQAERIFREVLTADPGVTAARMGLVRTLLSVGRHDEALVQIGELRRRDGRITPAQEAAVGLAYAGLGRVAEAREIAERLAAAEGGPSVDAASVFGAIGDAGRALDLLELAVDQRAPKVLFLRLDARFDPLRSHPRFNALTARLGSGS